MSRGNSSTVRGADPSAFAKESAALRPASSDEAKSLSVNELICCSTDAASTGMASTSVGERLGCLSDMCPPPFRASRLNCGSWNSTCSNAPSVTPQAAAVMPMVPAPAMTPIRIPVLNATPTAAGPAKRPCTCRIAVKRALNPCSISAGAITRRRSAAIWERSGPMSNSATGPSGQMAMNAVSAMSTMPTQAKMDHRSPHALSVPDRSRSCWNTGMSNVVST